MFPYSLLTPALRNQMFSVLVTPSAGSCLRHLRNRCCPVAYRHEEGGAYMEITQLVFSVKLVEKVNNSH